MLGEFGRMTKDRKKLEDTLCGESLLTPSELVAALCDFGIASDMVISIEDIPDTDLVKGLNYFRKL